LAISRLQYQFAAAGAFFLPRSRSLNAADLTLPQLCQNYLLLF